MSGIENAPIDDGREKSGAEKLAEEANQKFLFDSPEYKRFDENRNDNEALLAYLRRLYEGGSKISTDESAEDIE